MGLGPNFKKFVAKVFPDVSGDGRPPDAVVVDAMVVLHTFSPRPDEESPAQRLVSSLWYQMSDVPHAALCFDVTATTPCAKTIEWATRPAPTTVILASDVEAMLLFEHLFDYSSIISSRSARAVLCQWLVRECVVRMRTSSTLQSLLVLSDSHPMVFERQPDGSVLATRRDDLALSLHGEADVSGIFAARHLWSERCGRAGVVECRTSDTDWVLIGMLNCFDGLRIRLHHFDRATKLPIFQTVFCSALALEATRRYDVSIPEFATLVASRGTDFVSAMVRGVPDWDEYLHLCAKALHAVKARTQSPVVTESVIDAAGLHAVFVEASSKRQRTTLKYQRDDGELARLVWHVFYMMHCPRSGGAGLDCLKFGWTKTEHGKVEKKRGWERVFHYSA
jgi:hypothetical protein